VERHAGAERVLVQCGLDGPDLVIEIEDDGEGFEPEQMAPRPGDARGLGLMGMRERLDLFGGSVQIESSPGAGSRVVIRVPVTTPSLPTAHVEDPRPAR
jgi:signal transduction histidine kinase